MDWWNSCMEVQTEKFDREHYEKELREQLLSISAQKRAAIAARAAWRAVPLMFQGWTSASARDQWWAKVADGIQAKLALAIVYETHGPLLHPGLAQAVVTSAQDADRLVNGRSSSAPFACYAAMSAAILRNDSAVAKTISNAAFASFIYYPQISKEGMAAYPFAIATGDDLAFAHDFEAPLSSRALWPGSVSPAWVTRWVDDAEKVMNTVHGANGLHAWLSWMVGGEPPILGIQRWLNDWWLRHPDNKNHMSAFADMPTRLATKPKPLERPPLSVRSTAEEQGESDSGESDAEALKVASDIGDNEGPRPSPTTEPEEILIEEISAEYTKCVVHDAEAELLTPTAEKCKVALRIFLASPDTKAPLTVSVEAPWGAGKSSFMRKLQSALEHQDRFPTVWFNPWEHEAGKTLWAAFAVEYERQMGARFSWLGRLRRRVLLNVQRLDIGHRVRLLGWSVLLVGLVVGCFMGWLPKSGASEVSKMLIELVPWAGVLWAAWKLVREAAQVVDSPLKVDVVGLLTADGHSANLDELHRFNEDFARMVRAYTPGNGPWERWLADLRGQVDPHWPHRWRQLPRAILLVLCRWMRKYLHPLVIGQEAETIQEDSAPGAWRQDRVMVFIDDLDRCEAPKAAEVLQSLHLMLNSARAGALADDKKWAKPPGIICVLGMDREKVAAAVAAKHDKLLPVLLEMRENPEANRRAALGFGHEFLEKFVQLTLHLPGMVGDDEEQFLRGITGWNGKGEAFSVVQAERPASLSPSPTTGVTGLPDAPPPVVVRASKTTSVSVTLSSAEQRVIEDAKAAARTRKVERKLGDGHIAYVCTKYVAEALEHNPRKLKQFVNLFRLRLYLAGALDLLDIDTLDPSKTTVKPNMLSAHHLAKLVALDLICPQSMGSLRSDSSLGYARLKELSEQERKENEKAISAMLNHGRSLNPRFDDTIYDMNKAPLEIYFQQLAAVAPAPVAETK